MTDATRESYEGLRDRATGEAGELWKLADRQEANLRDFYRSLREDPRYTSEHKAEQAWGRYKAEKEKIVANRAKARELLKGQVASAERMSFPFPDGEGLITNDPNKILASQYEAARMVRRLDRLDATKGPIKPDRAALLRDEYRRGLEVGGVQGGAICRGVLEAADELGVDKHAAVDPFRKERHRESLECAERSERLTRLIGGRVPEPPFPRPGVGRERRSGALLVPHEGGKLFASRGAGGRPTWK
jgi:hypothetical protein